MAHENRHDGYVNMLTKAGTWKDSTEAYVYRPEAPTSDAELAQIYSSNGLFTKIIDKPAELAFRYGYDLGIGDQDIADAVTGKLSALKWKTRGCTALKWARLFGGACILIGADDGLDWDDPVDMGAITDIKDLVVFERPEIQPDYQSVMDMNVDISSIKDFGMPEFYYITPIYGGTQIKVHRSRLMLFRNGQLPRTSIADSDYRFFGAPEYNRIKHELKDTVTTHGNGYRLLERCVQAVYKMKNLSSLLATKNGEDDVIKRMQLIDMARSLLNTMVIDGEGEEFSFQTFTLTGAKDIIDESCNMLSAVTNIPQTVLFGRSPAGENATGESDLTNYYDFVGLIQETNVTDNLSRLVGMILAAYKNRGRIEEIPDYHLEACPLWNLSGLEQAQLDQAKASAAATKAQTAQIYVDMQALDASEVRKTLAKSDDFQIDEILSEDDLLDDELMQKLEQQSAQPQGVPENGPQPRGGVQTERTEGNPAEHKSEDSAPDDEPAINIFESGHFNRIPTSTHGCGVYIVDNGRILCGTRADNNLVGGPGGHVEPGETPIFAAVRETMEEFGIVPENLVQFGYASGGKGCIPSTLFVCTNYIGSPKADGREMKDVMWLTLQELDNQELFPAFRAGTEKLIEVVLPYLEKSDIINTGLLHDSEGDDDIQWITMNGARIPIKNGKPVEGTPGWAKDLDLSKVKFQNDPDNKPMVKTGEPLKSENEPEEKAENPPDDAPDKTNAQSAVVPARGRFGGVDSAAFVRAVKVAQETQRPEDAWRVTASTQADFEENHPGACCHITPGGSVAAVDQKGDIVSVCVNPDDQSLPKRGKGKALLAMAVKAGGNRLDSYEGNHGFYVKCGFEPVSWCKWDDEFAPDGWVEGRDQREDIIFYKYTGEISKYDTAESFKTDKTACADYDEAEKMRDKDML